LLLVGLAAYSIWLARQSTAVAGGSDSSGYLNSARLLASGHLRTPLRVPELGPASVLTGAFFQPLGFSAFDRQTATPTYPSGLPLHYAAAGKLLGWEAGPLLVGLGAALAALILCYAVAREMGLAPGLATACAAALAAFPPFVFASIQPLSDTLATAWCLAAVLAALRAQRNSLWALGCGLALAVAVLVRPSNLLLLPALVVLLGLDARRLALFVAGGLPGAAWLAFYNHTLYGGVFRSGYPLIDDAFRTEYFAATLRHFVRWLAVFLPAIFLLLPFAVFFDARARTRTLLALALWFGGITSLYLFYAISQEAWSCLRFLLPAVPALIIAALRGLQAVTRHVKVFKDRRVHAALSFALAAWALAAGWHWTEKFGLRYIQTYEQPYADACIAARTQLPPNALIVAFQVSGALYFYTDRAVLRWDALHGREFFDVAALASSAGIPLCAVLFDTEEKPALREHCPGEWTKISTHRSISLWRLVSARAEPIP
jgi:4-amino-4-deoxy-L-arabinose transferase-like glycosyltransferase